MLQQNVQSASGPELSQQSRSRHLHAALEDINAAPVVEKREMRQMPMESADELQARVASIVESSDDAILSKDLDGTIRTWNPSAQRMFGFSAREIIGRQMTLLIPPERLHEEKMILQRIRRGQVVDHYETVRRGKDGWLIDVSISVSPLRNQFGRVIGGSMILRDITERKRAEAALRASEERFRLIYQHAPVGLEQIALDNGQLLEVNDHLCQMLGYSREQLLKKSFDKITDPRDLPDERRLLRSMITGRVASYTIDKRYVRKDGRKLWVRVTSARGAGHNGRPFRISVIQNINEQKEAEAALRESEQRMRAVVQTAVDAIITIDERGVIESLNPATERLFGYSSRELIGRNVKMLMPEPYHNEHDQYLRNYMRTGRKKIIGIGREVTALRKDGRTFPMSLSVSEVMLGDRRVFTGIVHDLSGRRELEREIVNASTEEQRRIGQDLHDGLCQDLIGIAFQTDFAARQLASRSAPETECVERLAMSIREAAGQARNLSHGLNPVDLNAGGLPAALEALAAKVAASFKISCRFSGDDATLVPDDITATHLYRIAQEAVSNAIKHGKARHVKIQLTAGAGKLTVSITDDGVGLPPSLLQGASSASPAMGAAMKAAASSSGIGLNTMHHRANMIGGTFGIRNGRSRGVIVTCIVHNDSPGKTRPDHPGFSSDPREIAAC